MRSPEDALFERRKPKKVIFLDAISAACPTCDRVMLKLVKRPYCKKCGQKLEW